MPYACNYKFNMRSAVCQPVRHLTVNDRVLALFHSSYQTHRCHIICLPCGWVCILSLKAACFTGIGGNNEMFTARNHVTTFVRTEGVLQAKHLTDSHNDPRHTLCSQDMITSCTWIPLCFVRLDWKETWHQSKACLLCRKYTHARVYYVMSLWTYIQHSGGVQHVSCKWIYSNLKHNGPKTSFLAFE